MQFANQTKFQDRAIRQSIIICFLLLVFSGCNTLSSLGLPLGGSSNEISRSARAISESPGNSLALPRELASQPLPIYTVEIGDTVLLEPVKFDATIRLPGDQVVKPDGFISLGEFGQVYVHGKTILQIEEESQAQINQHLRADLENEFQKQQAEERQIESVPPPSQALEASDLQDELPLDSAEQREDLVALQRRINDAIFKNQISARLVTWDSKKIYVLGEVNSPGSFPFIGNETALDGIIEAGGMTSKANRHQIIIARPTSCESCRIVMKVCYDQIVQLGDSSTNYQLQPGDRVFVPSLTFGEDLKQSIFPGKFDRCPRCANCQQGCQLPTGCEANLPIPEPMLEVEQVR